MARHPALYLGLLSGTSMDGVDAAVVALRRGAVRIVEAHTRPYPAPLLERLRRAAGAASIAIDELCALDHEVGAHFAASAMPLLARHPVRAIGSHGQTLRHRPRARPPYTLQIGDPHLIAERTGVTTVADFRRRDVAAGGDGAPLTPAFHRYAFGRRAPVAVLNLGGIANVTLIGRGGEVVAAFDTGPGNVLLDHWARTRFGIPADLDGSIAAHGRPLPALRERLLAHPFFDAAPPKSTGPEELGPAWLEAALAETAPAADPADVMATLAEVTAHAAAAAIRRHLPQAREVLVCGGGARNRHLMALLARTLTPGPVHPTDVAGVAAEWVEAAAFAWLARERLAGRAGNVPAATGAERPVVLGAVYAAGPGFRR